ncbi:MAG: 2-hydroxyacyl-CoA dehydratase subunit D [Anaerolineae bacterium]
MIQSNAEAAKGRPSAQERLVEAGRIPLNQWPVHYPGYQAMGYLCSYVPGELLHAAGFTPVRVRGNQAPLRHVDAQLQSFTCALCRSSFDQALGGELSFLAGTVFAHTCDTMQALADLWRLNFPSPYFVDAVMLPTHLGTPAARSYLIAEFSRVRHHLAAFVGHPVTDDDLKTSIALYNETRRLIGAIQSRRDLLSASEFFAILDAAQVMPREIYHPLLQRLLTDLEGAQTRCHGPRLFLTGAVLDEPRLLDLIQELGAQVVGDDLCSGSRHFQGQVEVQEDPIAALADYFLQRTPCPAKFHPTHSPGDGVLEQVRRSQAQGVVFILEKFCESHAFDYALARTALDRAGVPHLFLEMEQTPSLEAVRTRLQAFLEML